MTFLLRLIEWLIPEKKIDGEVTKILVVDMNYLGDLLMSSPIYRAISFYLGHPAGTVAWDECKEVLFANPHTGVKHLLKDHKFWTAVKMMWSLRGRYDLVMQVNTSLKTNFLMLLTGCKYRLGYNYKHRGCFNNIRVPIAQRVAQKGNRIDECIHLLEIAFDWYIPWRKISFVPPLENKVAVHTIMEKYERPWVVFHMNCKNRRSARIWPSAYWRELAVRIHKRYGGTVFFTGVHEDWAYIESTAWEIGNSGVPTVNLTGVLTLRSLGAFLQGVNLLVCVNTAIMHLAAALGTPTVALVGETPVSVVASNVSNVQYIEDPSLGTKFAPAMDKITVDSVMAKVAKGMGARDELAPCGS
jgi:ADP-heptose:LPS heptosyltransferase